MISSYGRLRPGSVDEAAFKIRRLWEQEERQQLVSGHTSPSGPNASGTTPATSSLLLPVVAPPASGRGWSQRTPRMGSKVVTARANSVTGTVARSAIPAEALALGYGAAAVTAPAWLPGLLGVVGLGLLLSSDTPQEDEETRRCREVKEKCIDECSIKTLPTKPRWDQGMPFRRCVNECLRDNDCPSVLGANGKY